MAVTTPTATVTATRTALGKVAARFDAELEKVTKTGADVATSLQTVQSEAQSIGTGG